MSIISTLLLTSPINASKNDVPIITFDGKYHLLDYNAPSVIYPFEFIERDFPDIALKIKKKMCEIGKNVVYKYTPFSLIYSNIDSAYYLYDGTDPRVIVEIPREHLEKHNMKWVGDRLRVPIYNVIYKSELEMREKTGENFEIKISCSEIK